MIGTTLSHFKITAKLGETWAGAEVWPRYLGLLITPEPSGVQSVARGRLLQ